MSAEEPVMFPAIKPLRDLERFSKSTYPIDSKLVDGQQSTAPMKHRIRLLESDYFAKSETTAPIDALSRGTVGETCA
jgi:hypothetical protein